MADYYELLGVARTASVEEIRAAYRKRASESHPDRHPGDVQVAKKFCEFSQAYEVLMDSAQRRAYDRSGQVASFFEVPEPKKRSECTTCGGTGESLIEIGPLSFKSSCPDCEAEKPSPVSGDRP
jgi:DnaJ-class molecular chaperone